MTSELPEALRVARAWMVEQKPEDIADVFLLARALLGLEEQYEGVVADAAMDRENARAALEQKESADTALGKIALMQSGALAIIRDNGFVFKDIGKEPGNWQHLAFTLYNLICEIDGEARHALGIEVGDPYPASAPLREHGRGLLSDLEAHNQESRSK